MEEIKRMIEEAKHPHFNDAGHPHEGTYMFSEELFSLLENVAKDAWGDDYLDEFNDYWQQLLKAIDN